MMRKAMVILIALLFFVPTALYACGNGHTTAPACTKTISMKSDGKGDLVTIRTGCGKVYHFRMENGRYIPVDKEADLEA